MTAGDKFNRLTAIMRLPTEGLQKWLFNCDCGSINVKASASNVKSGRVKSCGCLMKEQALSAMSRLNETRILHVETGDRFGFLTALSPAHQNNHKDFCWTFRCDCGKENDIPVSSVKSGNTRSCGCRKGKKWSDRTTAVAKRGLEITPPSGPAAPAKGA